MTVRELAKALGTFHNVAYYAPEMRAFDDLGLPEYWRAYIAYRSAPMGIVPASVVEAAFYNFAPRVVQAAVPSAWRATSPAAVMARRDDAITTALERVLHAIDATAVAEAGDLVLAPALDCDVGARPLFAAHRDLEVPDHPLLRLWHGCTLWREHRGDGHNIALAAAEVDGIECHVLLAARGVGNQPIIEKIRGWTSTEWQAASARLQQRGLVVADGTYTDAGRQLRRAVESQTDRLADPMHRGLGPERAQRLLDLVEPMIATLVDTGTVAAKWPPQ